MNNVPEEALDRVVLVWLILRLEGKGRSVSALVTALSAMFEVERAAVTRAAVASLARLKDNGFIALETKLLLNDRGQAAALAALGVEALPKRQRADFTWAKKTLLVRALEQDGVAGLASAGKTDALAAWVLARHHGLPAKLAENPLDVWSVLAWRAIGCEPRERFRGPRAFAAILLGGPLAAGLVAAPAMDAPEPVAAGDADLHAMMDSAGA